MWDLYMLYIHIIINLSYTLSWVVFAVGILQDSELYYLLYRFTLPKCIRRAVLFISNFKPICIAAPLCDNFLSCFVFNMVDVNTGFGGRGEGKKTLRLMLVVYKLKGKSLMTAKIRITLLFFFFFYKKN